MLCFGPPVRCLHSRVSSKFLLCPHLSYVVPCARVFFLSVCWGHVLTHSEFAFGHLCAAKPVLGLSSSGVSSSSPSLSRTVPSTPFLRIFCLWRFLSIPGIVS